MADKKGPADYRDSKTGEFTTRRNAEKNPAGTEKEHNRKPPPAPPKKK